MIDPSREHFDIPHVLVPYTEFGAGDLAAQINGLVVVNAELLTTRGLRGVLDRYSDRDMAEQKIRKGQSEQNTIGHFAIVNAAGDVRGSAAIYPDLKLKKQVLPLPPVVARGPLSVTYKQAQPNIHAWTDKKEPDLLFDAYRELAYRATGYWRRINMSKAWTVEPARSPVYVHEAILESGLDKIAKGRFDDGESRRHVPPQAILYARLYSAWMSKHGRLKELRSGAKSFGTVIDDSADDAIPTRLPGIITP